MTSVDTPVPFFVAFSGKKQVGKDTATQFAKAILEGVGKKVAITAFAEPLKEMAISIVGLEREAVYGSDEQKNSPSHVLWDTMPLDIRLKYSNEQLDEDGRTLPRSGQMTNREVLQVIGTDIFRNYIDNDVWANAPFRNNWNYADMVILTDCRFPNEKTAVESNGGIVIRLNRKTGLVDNHASEIALDNVVFEHEYTNDGTLEELEAYLSNLLVKLKLL